LQRKEKKHCTINETFSEFLEDELSLGMFFDSVTEGSIYDILIGLVLIFSREKTQEIHYSYSYKKLNIISLLKTFIRLPLFIRTCALNLIKI
jgi:hypothetical protein